MSHIQRICLLGFGEDQVSSSPRQAVERLSFVKPCATATEGAAKCQLVATRLRAAESVDQHGASYVEAAVMSAIEPNGMASPMLLGQTVSEAGIEPLMSDACAKRQAWAARYAAALEQDALPQLLDAVAWMSRQDGQKARESEH